MRERNKADNRLPSATIGLVLVSKPAYAGWPNRDLRFFVAEQSREGSATQTAARRPVLKPHPAIEVRFHPKSLLWADHHWPWPAPLSETPLQIGFQSVTEAAGDLAQVAQKSLMDAGHQQTVDAFPAARVTDDHARQYFRRLDLLPDRGTPARQVPAGLMLGHDAFMPIGHHPLEKAPSEFSRPCRKHQCGRIDLGQQLGKNTSALQ